VALIAAAKRFVSSSAKFRTTVDTRDVPARAWKTETARLLKTLTVSGSPRGRPRSVPRKLVFTSYL